jgi:hypothetical protein
VLAPRRSRCRQRARCQRGRHPAIRSEVTAERRGSCMSSRRNLSVCAVFVPSQTRACPRLPYRNLSGKEGGRLESPLREARGVADISLARRRGCLRRQGFVAHSWPNVDRTIKSWCLTRPVTPEVAGSSPGVARTDATPRSVKVSGIIALVLTRSQVGADRARHFVGRLAGCSRRVLGSRRRRLDLWQASRHIQAPISAPSETHPPCSTPHSPCCCCSRPQAWRCTSHGALRRTAGGSSTSSARRSRRSRPSSRARSYAH